jgi:hypothetical protein
VLSAAVVVNERKNGLERRRFEGLNKKELLAVLVVDRVAMVVLQKLLHACEYSFADHQSLVFVVDFKVFVVVALRSECD